MREKLFSGYGAVIKDYRTKAGVSQAELAELLNVSRNTVINWENEKSQPDMFYIRPLCENLLIPLAELFQIPVVADYTADERRMVNLYRELSPVGQKLAKQSMTAFRDVEQDEREKMLLARGMFLPCYGSTEIQFVFRNSVNTNADFIATISGCRAEPHYNDGDRVYIRRTASNHPGNRVVCSTKDGCTVLRINDTHTPVPLTPCGADGPEDVIVLGRVLGVVQPEDIPSDEDIALLEELFSKELQEFRMENGLE